MTTTDRAVRVLRESLDRIWGYDAPDWADDIAADLHDAGLLAPEPRAIRTREELAALDPDALLYGRYEGYDSHLNVADLQYLSGTWRPEVERALPAVVIATGDQVRAARQALKETTE